MRRLLPLLLATCTATAAAAEVPRVVTDFGPVHSLVAQVMGDLGAPALLLPKGGDPHDFQLAPSQARALADADLIFWDGPELMPGLGEAIASLGGGARAVALLHDGGGTIRHFEGDEGIDPHAWLDPQNGIAWLGTIAAALAEADPENAATYTANAATAQSGLKALDAELATLLAPAKAVPFVVFHDALGYFADHYGLSVAGAIELGDATAPGAAQLDGIRTLLTGAGAACVFPEVGRDPRLIAAVTEGTPARIGAPQDIEALTLDAGPDLYATMLRGLGTGLAECLLRP